ncbi:MAG TPA: hypothetical protein VFP64_00790, partial [Pyrinomonadaceae bacterium]|nr:hypothetical protein [Pyrinomonadaceae bacterium]
AMPELAIPTVTNVNTNVMKIVFLIALISSPPPDPWPASQTLCQPAGSYVGKAFFGGKLLTGKG